MPKAPRELVHQAVDAYLVSKNLEKARQKVKDDEMQKSNNMSNHHKGTRFHLNKNQKERILERLDDLWRLELIEKENFEKSRRLKAQLKEEAKNKNDVNYWIK